MKLGALTRSLYDRPLDKALMWLATQGLEAAEIGCGAYDGTKHCNAKVLLRNPEKLKQFQWVVRESGLSISALACHANPLHPSERIASAHREDQRNATILAEKLGVDTVTVMAGCPGESDGSKHPAWILPGISGLEEEDKTSEWQWREKVIPYWTKEVEFAEKNGVKLAFEPHPGDVVFNDWTFFKLRKAVGKAAGVNFDPSHFFWQGIDPVSSILDLKDSIYHVHGKDTYVSQDNVRVNGVLHTDPAAPVAKRGWLFRTIGYGHGEVVWRQIISALRMVGYDYVISIEHEDVLTSREEGIRRGVALLKSMMITEDAEGQVW
jgi:sugar phosphate isomerase/epimerase